MHHTHTRKRQDEAKRRPNRNRKREARNYLKCSNTKCSWKKKKAMKSKTARKKVTQGKYTDLQPRKLRGGGRSTETKYGLWLFLTRSSSNPDRLREVLVDVVICCLSFGLFPSFSLLFFNFFTFLLAFLNSLKTYTNTRFPQLVFRTFEGRYFCKTEY